MPYTPLGRRGGSSHQQLCLVGFYSRDVVDFFGVYGKKGVKIAITYNKVREIYVFISSKITISTFSSVQSKQVAVIAWKTEREE